MKVRFDLFREKVLHYFEDAQRSLSREHPNVQISVGKLQEWPIYLSALLTDAPSDMPDLIDLEIARVKPPTGTNFIMTDVAGEYIIADVVWGHDGGGAIEAEFSDQPLLMTERTLEELYADLPRLVLAMKTALIRRKPYNW